MIDLSFWRNSNWGKTGKSCSDWRWCIFCSRRKITVIIKNACNFLYSEFLLCLEINPQCFFGSFWALFRLKTQFGETRGIFCADFYFTHKLSGNMQIMIVAHWKCTHSLLVFFFVVFMARFCTKKYHLEGFTSFWYYSAISSHNDNNTVGKIKPKWVT